MILRLTKVLFLRKAKGIKYIIPIFMARSEAWTHLYQFFRSGTPAFSGFAPDGERNKRIDSIAIPLTTGVARNRYSMQRSSKVR